MLTHQESEPESAQLLECYECGALMTPGEEPVFHFAQSAVLCSECAVRRGGSHDDDSEEWDPQPDLTGLYDESHHA